jgi:xanthine dehydrogenase YagS FAD-binding subunit
MMPPFEYARPSTIDEAIALLTRGAEPLAGGTDLLSLIKSRIVTPTRLVSLAGIEILREIGWEGGSVRIGAAVALEALAADPQVARRFPALVHAVDGILSPQIRTMGTVGGDLCQRPRCWYFRNGFGLLARHEGKPLVLDGDNRYHAIFGNDGPAAFVSPSSLAPALVALGAVVELRAGKETRAVPVAEFFRAPKAENEREIDLPAGAIVTEVRVPDSSGRANATYEVRAHESLDWPLAAAAVSLDLQGNVVRDARVVLGHVAPVPWPAPAAERALAGKAVTVETAKAAGAAAVAGAKPLSRNAYKVRLAAVAVERAVLRAAGKEV